MVSLIKMSLIKIAEQFGLLLLSALIPSDLHGVKRKVQDTEDFTSLGSFNPAPGAGPATLALTPFKCRWPVGDPRSEDFHYCGAACSPYATPRYCPKHAQLSLLKQPLQGRQRIGLAVVNRSRQRHRALA